MKPIKFDLPLNGIRIATLEQLEENLTPEMLEPFRSGKLAKWLRVRNLAEQAEAIEALLATDNEREVQLFKKLCELFISEVDENDVRKAMNDFRTSSNANEDIDVIKAGFAEEIEQLKADFSQKELELQQQIQKLEKDIARPLALYLAQFE